MYHKIYSCYVTLPQCWQIADRTFMEQNLVLIQSKSQIFHPKNAFQHVVCKIVYFVQASLCSRHRSNHSIWQEISIIINRIVTLNFMLMSNSIKLTWLLWQVTLIQLINLSQSNYVRIHAILGCRRNYETKVSFEGTWYMSIVAFTHKTSDTMAITDMITCIMDETGTHGISSTPWLMI